jgi:hypothetical protein
MSKRVTKLRVLAHEHKHHQRAANVMYKVTIGLIVELSNRSFIKTL